MRVKENKDAKVKKTFEPFSFTIDVQSEAELVELYHRFVHSSGKLIKMYDDGLLPKWTFTTNNCEDVLALIKDKVTYYDVEI